MTEEQEERLVLSLERIAFALMGLNETQEQQYAKQWPKHKEAREAVYSRIPTEEDLIREQHGASDESLETWLTVPEEEFVGRREREFLKTSRPVAGAETPSESGSEERSVEAVEDQA